MRHGDKINNLGRTASHRKALLGNLACQLIAHKRIMTTVAKAKSLRVYVEPLITKAKENSTHQHRVVFSYLKDKEAIKELFGNVAQKVGGRPGGYTRIIKLGARVGDNAEMALIELVDFNDVYNKTADAQAEPGKRTRRAGSRKKGPGAEVTEAETTTAEVVNTEMAEPAKPEEAESEEAKPEEAQPEEAKSEEKPAEKPAE